MSFCIHRCAFLKASVLQMAWSVTISVRAAVMLYICKTGAGSVILIVIFCDVGKRMVALFSPLFPSPGIPDGVE